MENQKFEYVTIPVADISRIDNTRSYTDPDEIKNLADSIVSIGLINPISVILEEDGRYQLITGARRLDAFILLKKDKIEAKVYYALSNEDAFILHCTENLQREDISIDDEVKIIRFMIETGLTEAAISMALGKSIYYVRTRKQLINTIPELWDKFKLKYIDLRQTAMIARYNDKEQKQVADGITNIISQAQLDKMLDSLSFSLENVPFLSDEELDHKMGACTKCAHNTSTYSLFKDEKAVCTLQKCFKNKMSLWKIKEFHEISRTESIPLAIIGDPNSFDNEEKLIVKSLTKKHGNVILNLNETDHLILKNISAMTADELESLLEKGWNMAHAINEYFYDGKILYMDAPKEESKTETSKEPPLIDRKKVIENLISDYGNKRMALTQTKDKKDFALLKSFLEEKKYTEHEGALSQEEWSIFISSLLVKTKRLDIVDLNLPTTKISNPLASQIYEKASQISVEDLRTHILLRSFISSHISDQDSFVQFFLPVANTLYPDWEVVAKDNQDSFERKIATIDENIAMATSELESLNTDPVEYVNDEVITQTETEDPPYSEATTLKEREWTLPNEKALPDATAEDIINSLYGEDS